MTLSVTSSLFSPILLGSQTVIFLSCLPISLTKAACCFLTARYIVSIGSLSFLNSPLSLPLSFSFSSTLLPAFFFPSVCSQIPLSLSLTHSHTHSSLKEMEPFLSSFNSSAVQPSDPPQVPHNYATHCNLILYV